MNNVRIGIWTSGAVVVGLAVTTLLMLGTVGQELLSGVSVSLDKWGARETYAASSEPSKYWASVVSHSAVALILGFLSSVAFWLALLEAQVGKSSTNCRK